MDIVDKLRSKFMDTKKMLPCELEHTAAAEIESLRSRVAELEAMVANGEPVAYATTNEEGDLSMLFFDHSEARTYCADGEQPIPLGIIKAPTPEDVRDAERIKIAVSERDIARKKCDSLVRILTGIHALLYPPRFTDHDGRTWQFKSPIVEDQMQELSDRIRALPDELSTIDAAMREGEKE